MSETPRIKVREVRCFVQDLRTRFPFRYGIAHMTALPHLFLRVVLDVDGRPATGLAAEHLPPKWFTKDPTTRFEEDLPAQIAVIRHAARAAETAPEAASFFAFWEGLYREQHAWAMAEGHPPLLANLGVSLIERAVLDGACRAAGTPLLEALRRGMFGIVPSAVHPEMEAGSAADLLPAGRPARLVVRHTVGLGDPLTEADLEPGEAVDDGLPQVLADCIRTYGLTHFKVKVGGDLDVDRVRLQRLALVLREACGDGYRFTLDGNEQYASMAEFRGHWEEWVRDPDVRAMMGHLLFVEQPVHRRAALDDGVAAELEGWAGRPAFIIDESDATLDSLPRALALGYEGTSHKNCKGIVKGLVNAALLRRRRAGRPQARVILSGEDLSCVGPVALLQDLTMMATLGVGHVERNGHHYFRGLSMFPQAVQRALLEHHADLYERHPDGFPTLRIRDGQVRIESLMDAPFGVRPLLDPTVFTPLDAYTIGSY